MIDISLIEIKEKQAKEFAMSVYDNFIEYMKSQTDKKTTSEINKGKEN